VMFAMVAQIGEQVDYLRFMPPKTKENSRRWWFWLTLAGPGWIFIGIIKMLLGSFLAYLAISSGSSALQAADPTFMYQMVFNYVVQSPTLALVLAALMVIISQMKINVTNAYAGSIAWSNFFSRLTHSHPGRVVWLVFNVAIALILMELGMHRALEAVLGVFAIVTVSWLGCLSADLMINKPLGLSPSYLEFKRAHLYDINPVGAGSMLLAVVAGFICYLGVFGEAASALAHFISLGVCFVSVPAIACLTKSRFYLARQSPEIDDLLEMKTIITSHSRSHSRSHSAVDEEISLDCCICEKPFEREDMSYCPAYQGAICSLCCSLDSRCMDACKPGARFSDQLSSALPASFIRFFNPRVAKFIAILSFANIISAALLGLIYFQMQPQTAAEVVLLQQTMVTLFFILLIICGVICWLFLLAHESRAVAQQESGRQTMRLIAEVEAHNETDLQLQNARDLAERANSAKSRYLSGISHELRTPLQAILGYAQLLSQRQDMPARHRDGLLTIKRSGEYLADLIEGLLDISKIEAGRLEIYRNNVQLPELIEQLVQMFQEMALEKGLRFNCYVHSRLPDYVTADQKRLRQILINLLSNAIKYTAEGSVEFHVHYRNQVAEFSIIDTGVGINPVDLRRILDPFERVHNPDLPSVSGTGLGLTIVKLLTEIMGGDLEISSTPGTGSCFKVALMLARVDQPIALNLPRQFISGYQGPRKIIMTVDDEPVHRALMGDLLSPLDFTVFEAHDAHSCIEALHQVTPDLFLLDVSMPGIDGLTLASMLRSQGCQQPVIMISADAQERHRSQQHNELHDDYLVKPINNAVLLARIGELLGLSWRHQESEGKEPAAAALDPSIVDHPLFRELIACARIGYKSGVSARLAEIEAAALIDEHLLEDFRKLVSAMAFQKLVDKIEQLRGSTVYE